MDLHQEGVDFLKIGGFSMGCLSLSCFDFILVVIFAIMMNLFNMHLGMENPRMNL